MTKDEELKLKIREYVALDQMLKAVKGRLDEIGKQLRDELVPGTYTYGEAQLIVQLKDRTKLDIEKAHSVLGHLDEEQYCTMQPDEGLIEQLYFDEEIGDDELRELRVPEYSVALIPRKVTNVQG